MAGGRPITVIVFVFDFDFVFVIAGSALGSGCTRRLAGGRAASGTVVDGSRGGATAGAARVVAPTALPPASGARVLALPTRDGLRRCGEPGFSDAVGCCGLPALVSEGAAPARI